MGVCGVAQLAPSMVGVHKGAPSDALTGLRFLPWSDSCLPGPGGYHFLKVATISPGPLSAYQGRVATINSEWRPLATFSFLALPAYQAGRRPFNGGGETRRGRGGGAADGGTGAHCTGAPVPNGPILLLYSGSAASPRGKCATFNKGVITRAPYFFGFTGFFPFAPHLPCPPQTFSNQP